MKNTLFLLCIAPFISLAQDNHKIQVLISNDYDKPVTVSYLGDKDEEVRLVVNAADMMLYKIAREQFLHLKPRFFELDGKVYQVKFSIPSADKFKIEVRNAVKKPQGITLQNIIHSLQIHQQQTLYIHIDRQGVLSLGVVEKKKLA